MTQADRDYRSATLRGACVSVWVEVVWRTVGLVIRLLVTVVVDVDPFEMYALLTVLFILRNAAAAINAPPDAVVL